MVHRQTGAATSFRAYDGGGGRTLIDKINDSPLMQAMTGQGMKGEAFSPAKNGASKGPESPQNYGFTSVVADALGGAGKALGKCAEGFMNFIGGNRSFPVCGVMDDRRHRLKNLAEDAAKGSSAMFGLKEWGQQFLNTDTGQYLTGNIEKKHRFALVENQNGKTQQQGSGSGGSGGGAAAAAAATGRHIYGGGVLSRREEGLPDLLLPLKFQTGSGVEFEIEQLSPDDVIARSNYNIEKGERGPSITPYDSGGGNGGGGGGDGGGGGGATGQATGQKTLHKEDSTIWIEQNKKDTQCTHGDANSRQRAGSDSTVFYGSANSCQSTDGHSHIMGANVHIWVAGGCFSDMPIIVKRDGLCKDR